jgi:hypothetical protein
MGQTLAEAYSRAGREEDAQRVRAKRDALSAQRETSRPN